MIEQVRNSYLRVNRERERSRERREHKGEEGEVAGKSEEEEEEEEEHQHESTLEDCRECQEMLALVIKDLDKHPKLKKLLKKYEELDYEAKREYK